MTDYTTADRIAAKFASVRPKFAGAFHADAYDLVRPTEVSDGRGGSTVTQAVVETGRCALMPSQAQGREGLSGDQVESTYRQAVELPATTVATAEDAITINGIAYRIIAVMAPGRHDLFPVADLERVG